MCRFDQACHMEIPVPPSGLKSKTMKSVKVLELWRNRPLGDQGPSGTSMWGAQAPGYVPCFESFGPKVWCKRVFLITEHQQL